MARSSVTLLCAEAPNVSISSDKFVAKCTGKGNTDVNPVDGILSG